MTNDTPTGKIEQIGGVECYVATPTKEYSNNKVVLFLPDAYGITFPNAQVDPILVYRSLCMPN